MKRDLDLIRVIMLTLEEKMEYSQNFQSNKLIEAINDETASMDKLAYHIGLLLESNFIKAIEYKHQSGEPTDYLINNITSKGQDFIDTIRQDTTWNKIKERAYNLGGFSLSFLIEIGKDYLKNKTFGDL